MAAASGMLRYVCEVIDVSTVESGWSLPSISDFQQFYSTNTVVVAALSWVTLTEFDLHPSGYRRRLGECLEWEVNVQEADLTEVKVNRNTLTETYLLACCGIDKADLGLADKLALIRILLQAGANPMVRVEPTKEVSNRDYLGPSQYFWLDWLYFLRSLVLFSHTKDAGGISGSRSILSVVVDKRVTLEDIFNTTKGLLAQGANINFEMEDQPRHRCVEGIIRFGLRSPKLNLEITSSAMLWLEGCFNWYPEFREFAASVKPPTKRPWRQIVSIVHSTEDPTDHDGPDDRARAYPDSEESEMLWTVIEKWEDTGQQNDLDLLDSAMERVWRAHRPDIKPGEESDEENEELNEE
ncbi:MAG: hypothetical protein Q9225_006313 [Loekoesia sp. 1 TL-2023]